MKFVLIPCCTALGQKITFVSRNAGDEKNLHPSGREFFLIDLVEFFKQFTL